MSRLACTCGKSYDVSARAPGTKVRCRACQEVLVVPAGRPRDAARTASERLRRARGEPCPKHAKALAVDQCEHCRRWMCNECRAPAPSSHVCAQCGPSIGATTALPLDFGVLATPAIAAKLMFRSLPWVLVFNVLAHTAKWLIAIPFLAASIAIAVSIKQANAAETGEVVLLYVSFMAVLLVLGLFEIVLVPAADVVIFDMRLRNQAATLSGTLVTAFRRAWSRKGNLTLAYVLLLTATTGSLVIFLPFVLGWFLTEEREVVAAGILAAMPAAGAVLGAFGLSIPAVVLEHRSAPQAFGRAWNLARLRPFAAAAFGTAFVVLGVVMTYRLQQLEGRFGLVPALAVSFVADIAWPALLVAAYHGLVAEEARLIGRRS